VFWFTAEFDAPTGSPTTPDDEHAAAGSTAGGSWSWTTTSTTG
jgi:hypothetical protein